jgi:uncharacterized membrane protein YhaH (DUF805 family)
MTTETNANQAKKTDAAASQPFGLHIYLYLLVAILLLSIAAFICVGLLVVDPSGPRDWMLYAMCTAPAVFLAVLWLALKRCSAPDLSGFRALLFITAYMSIGVGSYSVIVAVPAVMIAILGCLAITMVSLFRGDPAYAPRQLRRLVMVYHRYRMYQ